MSITFSPTSVDSMGVQNPELAGAFRRAQWRMLLAAMLCYFFFYTGRQTFGFAIPGIQAEFGVKQGHARLGQRGAALGLRRSARPSMAIWATSSVAAA